ncbi:hypothetical protein [Phenylobacterium sp.]|jgi:hypothetical protein|uniref:hypothetical protein n=1 Tax=Phenylobacterium sp. TaxID=1871053 RepID=UPI002F9345AB
MNLVERYLAAVGRELPEDQRADIVAELRDELMSKIEEREGGLGRLLDRREQEALLVEHGHPLVVAHRYRRFQALVGPSVYPFWWAGLKAALVVGAGVYLVVVAVNVFATGEVQRAVVRAVPALWEAFLMIFAVSTLIAVAVERSGGVARLARWRPSQLPPARFKTRSRFDLVVEIGLGVVFILWWIGALRFRDLAPAGYGAPIAMAPTWAAWRTPVLAYLLFELATNLVALARPSWSGTNAALRLARNMAGAGLLFGILQTSPWFLLPDPGRHSVTEASLNRGVEIGLTCAALTMLALGVVSAWRLYQALCRPGGVDGSLRAAS